MYHFLRSHRRPFGITIPKYFLLRHGQYFLKQENQTARSLPSDKRREEHFSDHWAAAEARQHQPHSSLSRSRTLLFVFAWCWSRGRDSRVTLCRELGKPGGPFRHSYCSVLPGHARIACAVSAGRGWASSHTENSVFSPVQLTPQLRLLQLLAAPWLLPPHQAALGQVGSMEQERLKRRFFLLPLRSMVISIQIQGDGSYASLMCL